MVFITPDLILEEITIQSAHVHLAIGHVNMPLLLLNIRNTPETFIDIDEVIKNLKKKTKRNF